MPGDSLHEVVAQSIWAAVLAPRADAVLATEQAAAATIGMVLAEAQQHRDEAVKAATQAMWDEDGRSDTIPLGNLSRRLAAELAVDATLAALAALGKHDG